MKTVLYNIRVALAGFIMTIIDSVPGLSGAVFISIGGTLQKLWTCWENFLKPKDKRGFISAILFYTFFGIGSMAGMIGFAKVITMCFNEIPSITFWFFTTASIGGVFIYFKSNKTHLLSNKRKNKTKVAYFILGVMVAAIMTSIIVALQGRQTIDDVKEKTNVVLEKNGAALAMLFIAGYFSAYAMFTPGLSGGLILLLFNSYNSVYSGLMRDPMSHKIIFIIYSICVVSGIISAIFTLDKSLKKIPVILNWILFGVIISSQISIFMIFDVFIPDVSINWLYISIASLLSAGIITITLKLMSKEKAAI